LAWRMNGDPGRQIEPVTSPSVTPTEHAEGPVGRRIPTLPRPFDARGSSFSWNLGRPGLARLDVVVVIETRFRPDARPPPEVGLRSRSGRSDQAGSRPWSLLQGLGIFEAGLDTFPVSVQARRRSSSTPSSIPQGGRRGACRWAFQEPGPQGPHPKSPRGPKKKEKRASGPPPRRPVSPPAQGSTSLWPPSQDKWSVACPNRPLPFPPDFPGEYQSRISPAV